VVVPFGIDVDFWTGGSRSAEHPFTCVAVGNDRRRDFATLGVAWQRLRETDPAARLVLAANRTVPSFPAAERVDVPHRELRDGVYGGADVSLVLTLPNLHGSGMTSVLESMACKVPVVATDLPGIRPYVRHLETGWLVPPGDPAAVVDAVRTLREDDSLARRLTDAACHEVRDRFSSGGMARRLAEVVDDIRDR
jgi:glycosyltransferase involved in cell wall biosynthesis